MSNDKFGGRRIETSDPAAQIFEITPSDASDLAYATRGVYVGGDGDLKLEAVEGGTAVFAVIKGQIIPVRAKKVFATGTTATGLVALC